MAYSDVILASTPLRYWPLSNASGTSATELVASETGTASGMTMGGFSGGGPPGIGGASPDFTGTGHIVLRSTGKLLGGNASFTVEAWVNHTATSGTHAFYGESKTTSGGDWLRGSTVGDTMSLGVDYGDDTASTSQVSSATFAQFAWTLVHVVKSGTTYQVWWDGGKRGEWVDAAPGSTWTTAGEQAWAGMLPSPASDGWIGSIRDVAVYTRALTQSEIRAHYEAGTPLTRTLVSFPLFRPDTSVWNQRLDDVANPPTIDAGSAATVTKLVNQVTSFGVGANQGGGPMYLVDNTTATQAVRIKGGSAENPSNDPPALYNALQVVPVPAGMVTSTSVDTEVTIYNTDTNAFWEFWQARKTLLAPAWATVATSGAGTIPVGAYQYLIFAAKADGTYGFFATASPSQVAVNGSQGVAINWGVSEGANNYRIYRSATDGVNAVTPYRFLTSVAAPTQSFTDTGSITPTTLYPDTGPTAVTTDWGCNYAGYMPDADTDVGHWVAPRANWGATATSLPLMAGAITLLEGMARNIPHALTMALHSTTNTHVYPAQRHDFFDLGNAIPEGTRFQLDPAYDTSTIANPFLRAAAVAAQTYGMYVRDFAGAVSFYVEDWQDTGRYFNPAMFDGLHDYEVMDAFPFSSLRVIDPAWTLAQTTATAGATGPYWGVPIGA